MYQTPMQKQLARILDKGSLVNVISSLMNQGKYTTITELLEAYKSQVHLDAGYGDDRKERQISGIHKALDIFKSVLDHLPEEQKTIFMALTFKGMGMNYAVYTYKDSDFRREFASKGSSERYEAEYNALSQHPFVCQMRDNIRYASRENTLNTLANLWNNGDKDGFFYVYDAVLPIQNRAQYKRDPEFAEDSLNDEIATYPGLEFVIIHVSRGNKYGSGIDQADLPPLRILVSNKSKPFDYQMNDQGAEIKEGWASGNEEPDFWILTAKGKFTSLKSYMNASLKDRSESIGYGPYAFSSNDDRTYGTAANVMAEIHKFLRVPKNFEASAQDRLKDQVQSIETMASGKIYMNRFLRAQEWSTWHAALSLSHAGRKQKEEILGQIDYKTATRTMVTHGLVDGLNSLAHDPFLNDGDDEEIYNGYLEGMQELYADMVALSNPKDDVNAGDALDRYERKRGFHPDVLHFPIQERKRLAFQDLSDIAVASLTDYIMTDVFCDEKEEAIKLEILSQVPFEAIADVMIAAGDVTNFMRLYEYQQSLGTKINGEIEQTKYGALLDKK